MNHPRLVEIKFLQKFQELVSKNRDELYRELFKFNNDPVKRMRRYRMISQLNDYENQILSKFYKFREHNELEPHYDMDMYLKAIEFEIFQVTNRYG